MATNVQGTSRTTTQADGTTVVDTTPASAVNPTGVGGVAVYDNDGDRIADGPMRPAASMRNDPIPATTGSNGSVIGWIIGAILLIVLAFFLWQMLF